MKLYLASGNAHKVAEFQSLSDRTPELKIEVNSARAVGGMPEVVEDSGTFQGNARKKAVALHARVNPGSWTLADDSGLCVDELNGEPGVESAYYAGPKGDPAANLAKLVEVMKNVPFERRRAHFVCVLFLIGPDSEETVFEGRCDGSLLFEPTGGTGFGYDPLFVPTGFDRSFAELGDPQKNKLSHRGLAWAKFVAWYSTRAERP
jgi:XTP/dITP diphosphohydrolase